MYRIEGWLMEPFTAVFTNKWIIVPNQSEADSLVQDGYGYRRNNKHYLRGVETLYNVERGKINVIDEETYKKISFQALVQRLSKDTPEIWLNFIVYKDLRTRGFIIEIQNSEFRVYDRGDFGNNPPSYQLKIISEGKPELVQDLLNKLKKVEDNSMNMKLAVVDRRGEIVYYGVEEKIL
jgi:tRNA-intron endonuclease